MNTHITPYTRVHAATQGRTKPKSASKGHPPAMPFRRGLRTWALPWEGFRIIVNPRKLEHGFRRLSARIPYTLQGMRIQMFQLSGFCCTVSSESLKPWPRHPPREEGVLVAFDDQEGHALFVSHQWLGSVQRLAVQGFRDLGFSGSGVQGFGLLGGSWGLVSKVTSTFIRAIRNTRRVALTINLQALVHRLHQALQWWELPVQGEYRDLKASGFPSVRQNKTIMIWGFGLRALCVLLPLW